MPNALNPKGRANNLKPWSRPPQLTIPAIPQAGHLILAAGSRRDPLTSKQARLIMRVLVASSTRGVLTTFRSESFQPTSVVPAGPSDDKRRVARSRLCLLTHPAWCSGSGLFFCALKSFPRNDASEEPFPRMKAHWPTLHSTSTQMHSQHS